LIIACGSGSICYLYTYYTVNGAEHPTLLFDQDAVYLKCYQETPKVGSEGGIVMMKGLDNIMDGCNCGILASYGKNHLMDPIGNQGGKVGDRK
jgi:hypothetical protein